MKKILSLISLIGVLFYFGCDDGEHDTLEGNAKEGAWSRVLGGIH